MPNAALRWRPDDLPLAAAADGGAPAARGETGGPAVGEPAAEAERGRPARLFKLVGGRPEAVVALLGISDGHQPEVLGGLAEGDEVVTGGSYSLAGQQGGGARGPL